MAHKGALVDLNNQDDEDIDIGLENFSEDENPSEVNNIDVAASVVSYVPPLPLLWNNSGLPAKKNSSIDNGVENPVKNSIENAALVAVRNGTDIGNAELVNNSEPDEQNPAPSRWNWREDWRGVAQGVIAVGAVAAAPMLLAAAAPVVITATAAGCRGAGVFVAQTIATNLPSAYSVGVAAAGSFIPQFFGRWGNTAPPP